MKKLTILAILILTAAVNANAARFYVGFGTDPDTCKGSGGFCIIVSKVIRLYDTDPKLKGYKKIDLRIEKNKMSFNFIEPAAGEKETVFTVPADIKFDDESAKKLGYQSITVKKGEYKIEYSRKFPNGNVVIEIEKKAKNK